MKVTSPRIADDRPQRFRVRIRTLLVIVAIFALLLVIVMQQTQIVRQGTEIKQMRQQIDRHSIQQQKLQEIIRTQRDMLDRRG
jgi:cell division protein FtsL